MVESINPNKEMIRLVFPSFLVLSTSLPKYISSLLWQTSQSVQKLPFSMFQTNYFGNIGHFFYQAILKPFGRRHKALADFVLLIVRIPIYQVLCVSMHQREQYGRQNNSDQRFEPWLSICERVHVTFSTHT